MKGVPGMATQVQTQVASAPNDLGFEAVEPEEPKIMGGPQRVQVTAVTLRKFTDGKTFEINSDGSVTEL